MMRYTIYHIAAKIGVELNMVVGFSINSIYSIRSMVSHHKSRSFCINLYHVTMVLLIHFYYGASNKLAFVLYSDKSGFTLLLDLVIDLRSVVKLYNPPKVA